MSDDEEKVCKTCGVDLTGEDEDHEHEDEE